MKPESSALKIFHAEFFLQDDVSKLTKHPFISLSDFSIPHFLSLENAFESNVNAN